MASFPSIFNDVIGPVMRGPSSSHCAASIRIGRICRDLMDAEFTDILIEFDPNGSLATTHESQGSDMGLFGGFLGWEAYDDRLVTAVDAIKASGILVNIDITDINATHPNTYKLTLKNTHETHELTAISVGGGMIEIIELDGNKVSMEGDYFETLIYCSEAGNIPDFIHRFIPSESVSFLEGQSNFFQIKSHHFPDRETLDMLSELEEVLSIKCISPILPIMSRNDISVPFDRCEGMLEYNTDKNLELWELAVHYESERGNISHEEVISRMRDIVDIMDKSIHSGLKGTEFKDRILGPQSVGFKEKLESNNLLEGNLMNTIIMFVSSMMEVKSSMGIIVAAPTAGSCGALPGAVIGAASCLGLSRDETVKAMLAASVIGIFVATHATFAAEVGGCQAECGSGAGMAAAALTYMGGGSLKQSLSAASMALQNSLGMICDPIANRVEAPCLGKNVLAATTALSCTNMALANYDSLIPIDEVVDTMDKVGHAIDSKLRCTALGGLSITKTAKEIEARLQSPATQTNQKLSC
jgi:L-serine dehydratase